MQFKPEILTRHAGHYENHTVTTDDGYILKMFRIPPKNESKGVIVIQHGLSTDSTCYVGQGNSSPGKLIMLKMSFYSNMNL